MGDTPNIPVVILKNDTPTTNSRNVADWFGKRHADILRAIAGMECSVEFRERNFALTEERREIGVVTRNTVSIDMTKDGFTFLVMGFTGAKAAAFKEAYIARFNAMEAELRALKEAEAAALRLRIERAELMRRSGLPTWQRVQ